MQRKGWWHGHGSHATKPSRARGRSTVSSVALTLPCLGIATLYLLTPGRGPASAAPPPCYLSRYNGDTLSRHPSRTVAKMRFSFGVSDAAAVGLRRSLSAKPWGTSRAVGCTFCRYDSCPALAAIPKLLVQEPLETHRRTPNARPCPCRSLHPANQAAGWHTQTNSATVAELPSPPRRRAPPFCPESDLELLGPEPLETHHRTLSLQPANQAAGQQAQKTSAAAKDVGNRKRHRQPWPSSPSTPRAHPFVRNRTWSCC